MSDERTEPATPRKLRDARRRGQVWKSRDVSAALTLLAAALVLGWTGGAILDAHVATLQLAIDAAAGRGATSPGHVLEASIGLAARAIAPLFVALVVVSALGSFVQVGPLFAMDAIAWKAERLDPLAGARQLVSQRRAIELGKTLVVIVLVGAIACWTLRDGLRGTLALHGRDAAAALRAGAALVQTLLVRAGGALAAIAVLDVVYQRWRFLQDQRMTRRELEREQKDERGDVQVERERERLRAELAQHSELASIETADVLIVRGSELAIALRYDRTRDDAVPEVLARGRGEVALRMIERARRAELPIVEGASLAQRLGELAVGAAIPPDAYEAVAIALSAAWSERDRA